ncbi:MAG: 50S ribosomal protein L4 [Candidatus Geothermincolia bacterium]
MAVKVPLKNVEGKKVGEVELREELFGVTPNQYAVHQVVRMQRAAARAGTASTKRRSEVRGGGAKPWRQKGTGRARAGSSRGPIWRGGGSVFGPKPRDYSFRVPRKVRKLAFCSALSAAASSERITVVEDFALEMPSTKAGVGILDKLDIPGKIMIVLGEDDQNVEKSFRNLPRVETYLPEEINTYDILRFDSLLFMKGALEKLQGDGDDEGSA